MQVGDRVRAFPGGTAFEGRVLEVVGFKVKNGKKSVECKLVSGEQPDTGHKFPPEAAKTVLYTFREDQLEVIGKDKE